VSEAAQSADSAPSQTVNPVKNPVKKETVLPIIAVVVSVLGLLSPVFAEEFKGLLLRIFWKLPAGGARAAMAVCVIFIALHLTVRFVGREKVISLMPEKARRYIKKIPPRIGTGLSLFAILILTTLALAFIVGSNPPLARTTLKNNKGIQKSVTITRNMSGLELRITGGPMKDEPGSVSFQLERETGIPHETLDISGLARDGNTGGGFYFPQAGVFRVAGRFEAGDRLLFRTANDSGFNVRTADGSEFKEGKITFELWETPWESPAPETLSGLEGNIVFEMKEGADKGDLSDFEGKVTLQHWEKPRDGEGDEKGEGDGYENEKGGDGGE
jgi:hypothetical protein